MVRPLSILDVSESKSEINQTNKKGTQYILCTLKYIPRLLVTYILSLKIV